MSKLTLRAQSIVDDLMRIDLANPVLDKHVVEECFAEHLRLLGLPMLPVHWVLGPKEGNSYITNKNSEKNVVWKEAVDKARRFVPCEEYLKSAAIETKEWNGVGIMREMIWATRDGWYQIDVQNAFWTAFASATYLNVNSPAAITYGNILFPFVKAVKSGLGVYYVTKDEIICCPAPKIMIKDDRLHSEIGPAVLWPNGEAYYYYKGIQVTKKIIEKEFSWNEIETEENQEVRRIMLDIYDTERYVKESGMIPIHVDDFGVLYTKTRKDGTTFAAVKVVNSTPELDGSFKDYFIRINPTLYGGDAGKIAHAAVASTWRTKGGKLAFKRWQEYCPAYET